MHACSAFIYKMPDRSLGGKELLSIPSSRNCIFHDITFLTDLKKNITKSPFCISKVLKVP